MQCFIYKSNKKADLYLYLDKQDDFSCVPRAILKSIGQPEYVMQLEITPERKLARENAADVINGIKENGFFIQMPPTTDTAPINLH
ncbi:MAG: YcgL domain-containing protein [Methyloprofundus sp.]|nr:YcgL domain-containing protein [Methyloprofundus sp.]MDT8426502.1 YcgL domain-containing protein [Methyloprofundus sp.]